MAQSRPPLKRMATRACDFSMLMQSLGAWARRSSTLFRVASVNVPEGESHQRDLADVRAVLAYPATCPTALGGMDVLQVSLRSRTAPVRGGGILSTKIPLGGEQRGKRPSLPIFLG